MKNTRNIKTIFTIDVVSTIESTEDTTKGEASTGYTYKLDTSFPELAFAIAGFLKVAEEDTSLTNQISDKGSLGAAFITLIETYYNTKESK